jgi:hypothetical protein
MEVLDRYIQEMSEDTALDEFTMKDVQMKLPGIKHKWTGRLIRSKIQKGNLSKKRQKHINKLTDKLLAESPIKVSVPIARQKVETHESITAIDDEIRECEFIIHFLEKVERILNSMTFDIKNLTEIMKLELQ